MIEKFLIWAAMTIAPFGAWESPITTDLMVGESIHFFDMQAGQDYLYWTELHPKEKGRIALGRFDGKKQELLLDDVSVRTRVHEYGGAPFQVLDHDVIYSNDADRQLYSLKKGKITDEPNMRFADGSGNIWVVERHDGEVQNFLGRIENGKVHVLASGHDFYSSPRLSPDGKQVAFITWDFPNMQWDSSTLWLADYIDGELHHLRPIAGGQDESVCNVQWSPDGFLHFVCDRTGFWNLHRFKDGNVENLCEMDAEFALAPWVFGLPSYAFLPDGKIICAYTKKGVDFLGKIDPEKKELEDLGHPFTRITNIVFFQGNIYFFGATPTLPVSLVQLNPTTNAIKILKQTCNVPVSEEWISRGEVLEYPSMDGKTGYAFYYPPKNPHFQGPEGEKPPLIVKSHGGPTARSYSSFMMEVQYWTTRGFAYVDVNYGGSTGYGREYFKRLEGNWGVVDVEDCISAAKTLVDKGLADPKRLLIRGGSSGGYTTLAALTFHDVFAAGTSYYGVCDLELLYEDTHKFESKYNDLLIAPYPEGKEIIRKRSPIQHIEKISKPILLLQGEEDKIVLSNQTIKMYEALVKKKIPVGMILFEGEGHGFRRAENIKRALDAELYFYAHVLGIDLPQNFEQPPVKISKSE